MTTPHKCPVCNGTGKILIIPQTSSTAIINNYQTCNACGGQGVVWEPESTPNFPMNPWEDPRTHKPILPNPPTFTPYDPIVPLTWPKDFKFPEDIQKKSKEDLIETLENWIKELKEPEKDEQTTDDNNDFCD